MTTYGTQTDVTMTLTAITDGQGRVGAAIDNSVNLYQRIHWYAEFDIDATTPVDGSIISVYIMRGDTNGTPTWQTDVTALADADRSTIPPNAQLIGTAIVVGTGAQQITAEGVVEDPGIDEWTIAIWNATGATFHATEANSFVRWYGEKA